MDNLLQNLITAIAEVEDMQTVELRYSIHDYIDTEALVALSEHQGSPWQLRTTIAGHAVIIDSTGLIEVDGQTFPSG